MRHQDVHPIFRKQLYDCYKLGKHYKDAHEMVFKLEDVRQCSLKTVQNLFSVWSHSSEEDIMEYLHPSGRSGKCGPKRKYDEVVDDKLLTIIGAKPQAKLKEMRSLLQDCLIDEFRDVPDN